MTSTSRHRLTSEALCRGGVVDFTAMVAQGVAQGASEGTATSPPRSPKAGARRKLKAGRKASKAAVQTASSPSQADQEAEGTLHYGLAIDVMGQPNPAVQALSWSLHKRERNMMYLLLPLPQPREAW